MFQNPKKFIGRFLKNFHKGEQQQTLDQQGDINITDNNLKGWENKDVNVRLALSSDKIMMQNEPVTVQIAFTKYKPSDQTEQCMSKESLKNMMRNDEEFNSFLKNEYQLNSTIIVEGIKNSNDESNIYVSGSIPVNVRRSIAGKKKNKEIVIKGKLYKPENKNTRLIYEDLVSTKETARTSPVIMRKVEVPLKELRSSLTGFTRRVSNFEVVPWLTASYIPPHYSHEENSEETLKFSEAPKIADKFDLSLNNNAKFHQKNLIALSTNLEYNNKLFNTREFSSDKQKNNNDTPPSARESFTSVISIGESHKTNKAEESNLKVQKDFQTFLENKVKKKENSTKEESKRKKMNIMEENSKEDKTFAEKKSYFEKRLLVEKKPEISDHSLLSENKFSLAPKMEQKKLNENFDGEEFTKKISNSQYIGMSAFDSNNYMSIRKSSEDNSDYSGFLEGRSSLDKNLISKQKNIQNVQGEEIPVTSITITRSRTRLIKYDDGSGIEEKIGRQTVRVEAPTGSLYTCKTTSWPIRKGSSKSLNSYVTTRSPEDVFEEDRCSDLGNIYTTQNVYHLKYPKPKRRIDPGNVEINYDELLVDKYNPLAWLYNNYGKTKAMIKQFSCE